MTLVDPFPHDTSLDTYDRCCCCCCFGCWMPTGSPWSRGASIGQKLCDDDPPQHFLALRDVTRHRHLGWAPNKSQDTDKPTWNTRGIEIELKPESFVFFDHGPWTVLDDEPLLVVIRYFLLRRYCNVAPFHRHLVLSSSKHFSWTNTVRTNR